MTSKVSCQCPDKGILHPEMAYWYHITKELPYVEHKPNQCKCTNKLAKYQRGNYTIFLCSNCTLPDDRRLNANT